MQLEWVIEIFGIENLNLWSAEADGLIERYADELIERYADQLAQWCRWRHWLQSSGSEGRDKWCGWHWAQRRRSPDGSDLGPIS